MKRITDKYVEIYLDQLRRLEPQCRDELWHQALVEIKERRAAGIGAEDRRCLSWLREKALDGFSEDIISGTRKRSIELIDKLLAAAEGKS